MARDIEECRRGAGEIAVEILSLGHQQPGVVQEGIVFVALVPCALFGRKAASAACRAFFYRTQLDGFLAFLDRSVEIALRLRRRLVGACLGRVHEQQLRVIVLVVRLHIVECLAEMLVAVIIYIVSGDERLIVACGGGVLAGGTGRTEQSCQHNRGKKRCQSQLASMFHTSG